MPLKVQFQGKAYALPFKGSSTIISVKEAVIQRAKVPVTPSSFSFYFDGCELGDEDTLDDLDIKDKDILVDHSGEESSSTSTSRDESTSNQPKIRVTIKSLGRNYKTVEVDPNSTIAQLAHQIIKIEGLENKGLFCQLFTDRMPIFYNGQTKDLNLTQIGLRNDQTVYAFFIKQELVPNMYTMNSEVQLFYQFSDYWKVQTEGIEDPSEQAISTFICTLHSLRHILIDMTIFSHAHFFQTLRGVLDFPPAVLAFYHIIFGTGMNFEKSLITEALMYYFRQVLPLSVSDKNILHEAPIVWAQLFTTTDVTTCEPDFYSTLNIVGWDGELLKEPVYIPGTDRLKLEDKTTLIKVQSTGEIEPVPDIKCLIQVLISTNQNHLSEYVCWDSSTDLSKKENIVRWSSKDYEEYWKILTKKDIFKGLCFAPGDQTEDHIMAVEATGTTVYLTGKMKGSEGYNAFAPSLRTQTIQLAELKSGNDFDVLKKPKSSSDRRNRMIDQIDMIMLDVSASMNAVSYKDGTTSIEAAKVYFGALVDKLIGLDLAHAVGLLCFGENLRETSPISTDFERLSTNLGSIAADEGATELYYAIERVVERIVEFENKNKNWLHKNYKKRIFCLTDGEDNSNNKPHKIAQYLQLHNVMLDCVSIGRKGSVLKCISSASGGWCFKVDSVQSGLALFESEPVLSTRERKPLDHDPVAVKDEKSLLEHKDESKYPHISKPERKIPDLTRKAVGHDKGVLGTKEEELGNPAQKKSFSTSGRPKRILLEFSKCHKHKFKQFTAFMDEVDFSFWKIIYTGETGTPYSGGHWLMYIQFPEDYPMSAPTIRFETKIYHCNVNNDGKICHEILSTSWSPLISMVDILQNISDMLKEPNFDDALDSVKGALYKDDKAKYNEEAIKWKQQYASTKLEQLMLRYKLE